MNLYMEGPMAEGGAQAPGAPSLDTPLTGISGLVLVDSRGQSYEFRIGCPLYVHKASQP